MQKIIGITIMTDPDYRQDPWRESIMQALNVFDEVVVICGAEGDQGDVIDFVYDAPGGSNLIDRIHTEYLDWPQPEWTFDELPRHLNFALEKARELDPDWIIKFDIDHLIHEDDKEGLRNDLARLHTEGKWLASIEKYQFFKVDKGYEKGKMPLAINAKCGIDIVYGYNSTRYTDLCQPIIWDGKEKITFNEAKYAIPKGGQIHQEKIGKTGIHIWNYDYSFKTYERAKELLYYFEISHAKFWGAGQYGKMLDDITPDYAMEGFLKLVEGRFKKCIKSFSWNSHPKHIKQRIKNIKLEEFGHSLWGKIKI